MAFVDVALAVGATVGLEGTAAVVGGGAIIGAGVGGAYSAITGDGNVLNSMLTGGLIGGAGAYGLGAMGVGEAATQAAMAGPFWGASTPALSATSNPVGSSTALSNIANSGGSTLTSAADPISKLYETGALSGGAGDTTGVVKSAVSGLKDVAPMTGKEMLGYGLAGTTALSLLGSQNKPKLSSTTGTTPGYIRPYTYSQTKNPNYGQPGESYYSQSYTEQPPYKTAAGGGLMAIGGGVGNMYPQSQQEHTNFATPTQMPTSAEVVNADFDPVTDPYTGQMPRYAEGGLPDVQQMPPPVQPATLVEPTTTYTPAPQAPTQLQQQVADYNKGIAAASNQEYNVMPAPLSTLPGGGQGASKEDLNKIINQYYVKNLGRPGEQAGLDSWSQQVQQGTSLADINKGIAASPESVTYKAYTDLLGRRPDEGGMQFWQKYIQEGHTPQEIRDAFMKSPEYLAKHPVPVIGTTPAVGSPSQADIDAYLAANPTTVKTYNPKTQTYSSPTVTQAMIDAWKASQVKEIPPVTEAAGGLLSGYAAGGIPAYNLGSYSDGGRLLKGPGDGVSDDIPAIIANKQPARLADGEFVIPARIVSEIGNGSTDAGAKRLYAMMDKIQAGRKKTIGKNNVAKDTKAKKHLLA